MQPCVEEHRKHTSDRPLPEHTFPLVAPVFFAPMYINSQSEYRCPSPLQMPATPVGTGLRVDFIDLRTGSFHLPALPS